MARKEAPKIDPAELYEEKIVYVIAYVDNSAFGRFYVGSGVKAQTVQLAKQFTTREQARKQIIEAMLEGVEILKVWV